MATGLAAAFGSAGFETVALGAEAFGAAAFVTEDLVAGVLDVDVLVGAAFPLAADLATALADAFSTGLVAVVGSTTGPPRAAEFLLAELERADLATVFDSVGAVDLAPFFAAAFAEVEAVFAAEVFTAAVFAAAAAVRTGPVDLDGDFAEALVFGAGAALEVARAPLADLLALLLAPPGRRDAAVTLAAFVFSFFLADGIRRALLLRPAVETGRITDLPSLGDVAVPVTGNRI